MYIKEIKSKKGVARGFQKGIYEIYSYIIMYNNIVDSRN